MEVEVHYDVGGGEYVSCKNDDGSSDDNGEGNDLVCYYNYCDYYNLYNESTKKPKMKLI